jgi:hypothetical protein
MAYKVLVAIDSTGLSELVLTSLSKQVVPDQAEVLVLEVVEPLLYTAPPEMSPGYQPEMAARRKERHDQATRIVGSAVEVFRKAGFKAEARVTESEIKRDQRGRPPGRRGMGCGPDCRYIARPQGSGEIFPP